MADSFSQLYIHLVISPHKYSPINSKHEQEIYKYISGILMNMGHKSIAINGMPDHVHIFVGLNPAMAISDLIRELKKSTNSFINNKFIVKDKYDWQKGYGAFSYSQSHVSNVYNYIINQKKHHKTKSFKEEYIALLTKFNIPFKDEYLFDF